MLLQDCFFIQRNYTALYNRMAVLFIAKSTAILKFYYFPLRHISRIRSSLLTNNTPIGPLNMLIAAHARSEDMILVTNNVREFARVPDLVVENWMQ